MHGIAHFNELNSLTVSSVGKMGQALGSLAQRNATVAPSFVVTSSALKEFVILSGIRDRVFSLLKAKKAGQLHDLLLNQEVPEDLEEDLFSHCSRLHCDRYICHSSSAFSDHDHRHVAENKHKILDAIKQCWASVVTEERLGSLNKNTIFSAVVVQPYPVGAKAGRLYTFNPLTNSKEKIIIEVTEPKPHLLMVNRGDHRVVNEDDFHTVTSPLFIDEKDALVGLAAQVGALYRKPQVVEWIHLGSPKKNKEMTANDPLAVSNGFAITRVSEFDGDYRQKFQETVQKMGTSIRSV